MFDNVMPSATFTCKHENMHIIILYNYYNVDIVVNVSITYNSYTVLGEGKQTITDEQTDREHRHTDEHTQNTDTLM